MGPILRKSNWMLKNYGKISRDFPCNSDYSALVFGLVSYNRRISARLSQFYVLSGRNDCAH